MSNAACVMRPHSEDALRPGAACRQRQLSNSIVPAVIWELTVGLAFLPWERLPAYVLGPLLIVFLGWALWSDTHPTFFHIAGAALGIAFGAYLIWHRYRTGKELFAKPESCQQRD